MEASVRTTTVTRPTHVNLTMTWDEAQALFPFLGKLDLNSVNHAMGWGTHMIKEFPARGNPGLCTCGNNWPCERNEMYRATGEVVFQMYAALDNILRKNDYEH